MLKSSWEAKIVSHYNPKYALKSKFSEKVSNKHVYLYFWHKYLIIPILPVYTAITKQLIIFFDSYSNNLS